MNADKQMVIEGSRGVDTSEMIALFYSLLAERSDLTDAQCDNLSHRFGILPHKRLRAMNN